MALGYLLLVDVRGHASGGVTAGEGMYLDVWVFREEPFEFGLELEREVSFLEGVDVSVLREDTVSLGGEVVLFRAGDVVMPRSDTEEGYPSREKDVVDFHDSVEAVNERQYVKNVDSEDEAIGWLFREEVD